MKKIFKIGIGVIVIVLLTINGMRVIKKARMKDTQAPKAKLYPVVVSHLIPKISDVKLTLPYLAEVQNDKDVKLSSRISAHILQIKRSGSSVKKGDVVAKLDTTSIKSSIVGIKKQLQAAKINLKNLRATHNRTIELLKVKGASVEKSQKEINKIANMEAQITSLEQKEIELKNNLSYATIISPVDGVIAKTFFNKGALSLPGKPLVLISSKNGFYLMLRVPRELQVNGIEFNNKEYKALSLESTYHGLLEYKVYIDNAKLTSGDRVEVNVVVFHKKALRLPFDAILNRDSKSYIFVIDKDRAYPQEVKILQSAQEGVVVSSDIAGKNIVLAKPDILLRLASGYRLKVKE